jgi:hypothetical protein
MSPSYPQSWTKAHNGVELKEAGHTVYRRGDGEHHWPATCSKCREEAARAKTITSEEEH